jgi:hypothetical protein
MTRLPAFSHEVGVAWLTPCPGPALWSGAVRYLEGWPGETKSGLPADGGMRGLRWILGHYSGGHCTPPGWARDLGYIRKVILFCEGIGPLTSPNSVSTSNCKQESGLAGISMPALLFLAVCCHLVSSSSKVPDSWSPVFKAYQVSIQGPCSW